jgi:hypothetical protein
VVERSLARLRHLGLLHTVTVRASAPVPLAEGLGLAWTVSLSFEREEISKTEINKETFVIAGQREAVFGT